MKIVTIVGARPQFIKCAVLSAALRTQHREIIIHTGQHYDYEMSQLFFDELHIPVPDYNLNIGSAGHGRQTGRMLEQIEQILICEEPDLVLIYGDTNSTLAGAIAAVKLHLPIAHVEAGMRRHDIGLPEEANRIIVDHCSQLLFCATPVAVENLAREGICENVYLVGDVMYDAILKNSVLLTKNSEVLAKLNFTPNGYLLATVHRAENTDDRAKLGSIISALAKCGEQVVFPVHPRTLKYLKKHRLYNYLHKQENVILIPPLSYLDCLRLQRNARMVITDSGGIQREAYLMGKPCITLTEATSWVETVADGWNLLTGSDENRILSAIKHFEPKSERHNPFGDGNACRKILDLLNSYGSKE